jgi:hypothetical protein
LLSGKRGYFEMKQRQSALGDDGIKLGKKCVINRKRLAA